MFFMVHYVESQNAQKYHVINVSKMNTYSNIF